MEVYLDGKVWKVKQKDNAFSIIQEISSKKTGKYKEKGEEINLDHKTKIQEFIRKGGKYKEVLNKFSSIKETQVRQFLLDEFGMKGD